MAQADAAVLDWGGLALATDRVNSLTALLDNAVDAGVTGIPAGKRLTYLEATYNLTHAPATLFQVFPGVTAAAAYAAALAAKAGSPKAVLKLVLTPQAGGGAVTFYLADDTIANVDTLYQGLLFTGLVDDWSYTLNKFTLMLAGTERQEDKLIPAHVVKLANWPISFQAEGKPYAEVWGSPGAALDAAAIGSGIGSVPAVLVDRAALKYVVAGHALTKVAGVASGAVSLWCKVPGLDKAFGYIDGCTFSLSDTDAGGQTIAWVKLPATSFAKCFLPTLALGAYGVARTATNPTNATGRQTALAATIAPGQQLDLAVQGGLEHGSLTALRVFLSSDGYGPNAQMRWVGPESGIVGRGAGYIDIDSAAGWDATGKVDVTSGIYTYTAVTQIAANQWRLTIGGYGGADAGTARMTGAWHAFTAAGDIEITTDRPSWAQCDFYKFELLIQNNDGSNSISCHYLGFRVWVELTQYPEMFVPCQGVGISLHSVDQGASSNPAIIVSDVYKRLEGLSDGQIGTTFDSVLLLLAQWKFDFSLAKQQIQSSAHLKALLEQARAFTWRDESNAVQIAIYRLDDASTLALDSLVDIIDPQGDDFLVEFTKPEEIFNQVYVKWGWDGSLDQQISTYFITETSSYPQDTSRQASAVASQAAYGIANALTVEAPFIQDATTALNLLQFLFDFHRLRRRRLRFKVPMQTAIAPGKIVTVAQPLLTASESYLVEQIVRQEGVLTVQAIAIATEATYEDAVGYEVKAVASVDYLWGSPQYWTPWAGANVATVASVTGRMVDYGLALLASRYFQDTAEKPAYGGTGTGSTGLSPADLDLATPVTPRVALESQGVSGAVLTIVFAVTRYGSAGSFQEFGLFSKATGGDLLARILLAAPVTLPQDATVRVTLTVTLKRPTAGSNVTDYGLNLLAQRFYQDTAEKPADYAIGSNATAAAPGDVALNTPIGARRPMAAAYPVQEGLSAKFAAFFAGGTYGGNTVREVGLFTGLGGNNAMVRAVPAALVIAANQDTTFQHKLTAAFYS